MSYPHHVMDRFDLSVPLQSSVGSTRICLVAEVSRKISDRVFQITAFEPEGISTSCAKRDFLQFAVDSPRDRFVLQWNSDRPAPAFAKYMFLDVDASSLPGFLSLDEESYPLPLENNLRTPPHS